MMSLTKIISCILAIFMVIGFGTACSRSAAPSTQIPNTDVSQAVAADEVIMSAEQERTPLAQTPLAQAPVARELLMPMAPGVLVESNAKAVIDSSNTADGYVMVKWITETTKQLRVQITGPSEVTYTYTLRPDGEFEVYPLSDGNGSYKVMALEQIEGTRYAIAINVTIDVIMADAFAPFLRPNQFVNYNENSRVVAKTAELVAGSFELTDRIGAVYNFIVDNFSYDFHLAETVKSGYLPNLDTVLERRMGICFDYAAVMTAMLRSQGIPTRLVVGYAGDTYHAWVSVFSEETGWVNAAVFFDGASWILMDPTFDSTFNSTQALQNFIGDGSSYTERFLY